MLKSIRVLARIGLPAAAREMSEGEALLTKTRVHIAGTLVAAFVLLLFTPAGPVRAEGVPQHLASMAKALYAGVKGELNKTTGDPQQDAIRRRARQILKDAGLRYWAQEQVRQKGAAAAVAGALEMDISKPDQRARLHAILTESDRGKQIDKLRQWAKDAGKPTEGPQFEELRTGFDKARGDAAKDMARNHGLTVGDNDDRLELNWDPVNNRFEIRIKARETSEGAGDGFDLQLNGDVTSAATAEGDDTTLTVRPSHSVMSVLTDGEIRRLQGTILGKWRDGDGSVWEISSSSGGPRPKEPAARPADQIAKLKRETKRIRSDKIYEWKNTETGDVVQQDKFKRLKEPFEYLGEKFRQPDAKEEIARLQKRIKEIRAAGKPLPVVASDPVRMNEMRASGKAQSLNIRVTDTDGYSWTYDTATLAGRRITARRTLRDMRDITDLPEMVARPLIASWSPPEWIELNLKLDVQTKSVHITGSRWRMHVTYSGDDYSVGSIHTPYARALTLTRDDKASLLRFARLDGEIIVPASGDLLYDDVFYVEAVFDAPQDDESIDVKLEWGEDEAGIYTLTRTLENLAIFRSEPIVILSPDPVPEAEPRPLVEP